MPAEYPFVSRKNPRQVGGESWFVALAELLSMSLILRDCTATILAMGGDDGVAGASVGSAITLCLDRVSVNQSRELVDVSCGQDTTPKKRLKKNNWDISVETKLHGTLYTSLQSNDTVIVTFTITNDLHTVVGTGIVESISAEYGDPSTLNFKIVEYGTPLTITAE